MTRSNSEVESRATGQANSSFLTSIFRTATAVVFRNVSATIWQGALSIDHMMLGKSGDNAPVYQNTFNLQD